MISIKINGIEYENVASCEPEVEYDYYYDITTMDGKRHRDIKGKRTNYEIEFYNNDFSVYDALKRTLLSANTVVLEIPNGLESTISGEYMVEVKGDEVRGKMWNGKYYNTALAVFFERVGYDE